jgi:propanol-preferring alcohol dehydrogenase
VGALVPAALRAMAPGGRVVCAGIHMSEIPAFPYEILWRERQIVSVANLTRHDGEAFLALAPKVPVATRVETLPLEQANEALARLREGRLQGAAVLTTDAERKYQGSFRARLLRVSPDGSSQLPWDPDRRECSAMARP